MGREIGLGKFSKPLATLIPFFIFAQETPVSGRAWLAMSVMVFLKTFRVTPHTRWIATSEAELLGFFKCSRQSLFNLLRSLFFSGALRVVRDVTALLVWASTSGSHIGNRLNVCTV